MRPGVYRHELVIADGDVDGLGHANNVVYVRWMIDAATAHSAFVGWDWDAYQRIGGIFIVRRHEIDYLLPARGGDRVAVFTWVDDFGGAQSLRRYELRLADGRACARATTTWVFVEVATGRPKRIPAEIKAAFPVLGASPEL